MAEDLRGHVNISVDAMMANMKVITAAQAWVRAPDLPTRVIAAQELAQSVKDWEQGLLDRALERAEERQEARDAI